jgi:CubicO group peptidase (beta-lactamase class C family)
VAYERLHGKPARFADIVAELVFKPLNMDTAAFYLHDEDPRVCKIPTLYGGVLRDPADLTGACGCDVLPYEQCTPPISVRNTVATDHFAGESATIFKSSQTSMLQTAACSALLLYQRAISVSVTVGSLYSIYSQV